MVRDDLHSFTLILLVWLKIAPNEETACLVLFRASCTLTPVYAVVECISHIDIAGYVNGHFMRTCRTVPCYWRHPALLGNRARRRLSEAHPQASGL